MPGSTDVESAYGSEYSTRLSFNKPKPLETMSFDDPNTKTELWYQWLKNRIKTYMIWELIVVVCLVVLLINSFKTSSQNDKMFEMMMNMESRMTNMELQLKETTNKNRNNDMKYGEVEESVVEPLRIIPEPEVIREEKPIVMSSPVRNSSMVEWNAANYLLGASIESSRSSSSNLCPFIGRDQSNLILLDRSDPPADKAWCTHEKQPILTINLAKYVKPVSVSYQHANGLHGAPNTYSVVGCLDFYCEKTQILVSNCEYSVTDQKKEQLCLIPHSNIFSFGKIQFHIHSNHGNLEETCVSLFRVNGESRDVLILKDRSLEDSEECSVLANSYNSMISFYGFREKNCKILYSKQCWDVCPECCNECLITDINGPDVIGTILKYLFFAFLFLVVVAMCVRTCTEKEE